MHKKYLISCFSFLVLLIFLIINGCDSNSDHINAGNKPVHQEHAGNEHDDHDEDDEKDDT